jgi:hypothetical protein
VALGYSRGMRHVYTGRDEMDAHFVKGLLQKEGIEATVVGENLINIVGTIPLTENSLPSVWVNEADEARATEIVSTYKQVDVVNADARVEDSPRPTWKCANCGEAVEEQFTECWNCGHSRPESAAVVDPVDGPH